jgi:hypothetical protein
MLSPSPGGTANTKAAKRTAAWARSASEKLDAMMAILGEVATRTSTGSQAPGRHPRRVRSAAAPQTTIAAYSGPVRLTQASPSPRDG